ncbi:phage portal protein [Alphaproteobacteria bacterium endosymbiont of Tiliacea citrago]|uniref:phage portal protein n=1 Tax=Alphaproteobacteria bacterium endosymbiont of Tiliacea citrago TaxID=3077944 RepID=UPI00313BA346
MFNYVKNFFKVNNSSDSSIVFSDVNCDVHDYSSNVDLVLKNACINRSISLIVNSITSLNFVVFKDGVKDNSSFVFNILCNPSDSVYFSDFIETFVWNFLIYGNSFVLLNKNELNSFDLINLPSSTSVYLNESKTKVAGYTYSINEKKQNFVANNKDLPLVGHFKRFNPTNTWYGYSFIDPVRSSANLYQQIDRHNLSVISNGGRPSGILSISPSKMLTSEEKVDFAKRFKEQNAGPDKAGQIFVLNGDCQWHQLSGTVKDMDYSDAARRAVRSIASGLGVPANLVGDLSISGENSRANIDGLFEIFNKSTVMPLANKISQFLTNFFRTIDSKIEIKLVDDNGKIE